MLRYLCDSCEEVQDGDPAEKLYVEFIDGRHREQIAVYCEDCAGELGVVA